MVTPTPTTALTEYVDRSILADRTTHVPTWRDRVRDLGRAVKSLAYPGALANNVSVIYSSMEAWDKTLLQQGLKASGDPRASSLVYAGYGWLGKRLPEARPRVVEPNQDYAEDHTPVAAHSFIAKWKRPNPYYTYKTMTKAIAYSWLLKGDVYILKLRNLQRGKGKDRNGKSLRAIKEYWYEPHWNVRPRWLGDNAGAYIFSTDRDLDKPGEFINYYEVKRGGKPFRVEVHDMIHLRDGIDPENPRCGMSGLNLLFREILGDSEAANFYTKLLARGGVPPFIITIDDKLLELDDEDLRKFKDSVKRQMAGENQGDPLVLANARAEKLAWEPAQLDLRVSRYMGEERFAAITGIPTIVMELGAGQERSIYRNVEAAERRAAQGVLVPFWDYFGEELTLQALPDFDDDPTRIVEMDTSRVQSLQEDLNKKSERVSKLYIAGVITRGKALSLLRYPPSDPQHPEYDNVFYVGRGVSLAKPEEEVLVAPPETIFRKGDTKEPTRAPAPKPNGGGEVVTAPGGDA